MAGENRNIPLMGLNFELGYFIAVSDPNGGVQMAPVGGGVFPAAHFGAHLIRGARFPVLPELIDPPPPQGDGPMPLPRIRQSLILLVQACDFILGAGLEDTVRQQNNSATPTLQQAIGEVLTRAPEFFPLDPQPALRMLGYPLGHNDLPKAAQFHPPALWYAEDGHPLWPICGDHVTLMVGVHYWTGFQRVFFTSISITFDGLRMQLTAACGVAIEHQFRVYVGTVQGYVLVEDDVHWRDVVDTLVTPRIDLLVVSF